MKMNLVRSFRGLMAGVFMLFATNLASVPVVFAANPPTSVTPTAPTVLSDPCGTVNDTFTIPSVTGVKYKVAGGPVNAGTTSTGGSLSVAITAEPQNGNFVLNGYPANGWTLTFTNVPCVTTIAVPSPVSVNDPCGFANATWVLPTVQPTQYTWSVDGNGNLIATAASNFVFTGGATTQNFGHATDSNALCPLVAPEPPTISDPCGLANAGWDVPTNTATISWGVANGHLVATAANGYAFNGQSTYDYGVATDSNTPCPLDLPNTPSMLDACGKNNAEWSVPEDTATVTWELQRNGHLVATAATGYIFPGSEQSHDYGVAQDSDEECPKITICHRTNAIKNPYSQITVDESAADGQAGNSGNEPDHYGEHTGPLFDDTMENGDDWGDIIPPIDGVHQGRNWTIAGQIIWNNDCNVPTEETPVDVCPLIEGVQTDTSDCDVCPNVFGEQSSMDDCDVCPLVEGQQSSVSDCDICPVETRVLLLTESDCDSCPDVRGIQALTTNDCDEEENKVTLCHATGSESNPFEQITVAAAAAFNGHLGDEHQNGEDIIPPFTFNGEEYSQNWDAEGQATFDNDCVEEETVPTTDVCPNIEGNQTSVPEGLVKNEAGDCVQPTGGQGGEETPPVVVPTEVPAVVTTVSTPVVTPAQPELADTGENNVVSTIIAFGIMTVALALSVATRRRATNA